jgi:hypothetical protein
MPIYEYELEDGRRVETILMPWEVRENGVPSEIEVDGVRGRRVATAAAFKMDDGTMQTLKQKDLMVWEPGVDKDIERNREYRKEKEDAARREAIADTLKDFELPSR